MDILNEQTTSFRLADDGVVHVSIRLGDEYVDSTDAHLISISPSGCKLRTMRPVTIGPDFELVLSGPALSDPISMTGRICWATPRSEDEWYLGCTFNPRIPTEVFDELTRSGALEKRSEARFETTIPTVIGWELSPEKVAGKVINLSAGGFCFMAPMAPKPGLRVKLHPVGGETTLARSVWTVELNSNFACGCEFVDEAGYRNLRELLWQA